MLGDPMLVRRLEAFAEQRAVRTHLRAQVVLRPHAMAWAGLSLAGEDGSLHALALGRWGRPPSIMLYAADPLRNEDREHLFGRLTEALNRYFRWCVRCATAPQLVVTSVSALHHLTNIADDLRFLRNGPQTAEAARLLSYFTERAAIPGQQAIVTLAETLTTHWATPLPPSREHHLGVVLACINRPSGADLAKLIEEAERVPMGPTTDPEFDAQHLEPVLSRYRRAIRRGTTEDELQSLGAEIGRTIAPIVDRLYAGIQHGMATLVREQLSPLPAVAEWQRQEVRAFLDFLSAHRRGVCFPINDRVRLAAFRLVHREDAEHNYRAAVASEDAFGRACSVCTGDALVGVTQNYRRSRHPTRRGLVHTFDVVTTQEELTLRPGDELHLADDPRLTCVVCEYRLEGNGTRVGLRVASGMYVPGVPKGGTEALFVRAAPDWHRLGRRRRAMANRLATLPWTHVEGAPAPHIPPEDAPDDPLRMLEALQ